MASIVTGHKRKQPTAIDDIDNLTSSKHGRQDDSHPKCNTILNKKSKTTKVKTNKMDPNILGLRRNICQCCATNNFSKAIQLYEDVHVKKNVALEPQTFYNLLNLCEGGLGGERGIHIGTPKPKIDKTKLDEEVSLPGSKTVSSSISPYADCEEKTKRKNDCIYTPMQRKEYAFRIKNEMDSLQIPLNETAYTALMRILCQPTINELAQAEEVLKHAEKTQQCKPKLRMYSCLMEAFCCEKNNNLVGALRTWTRMSNLVSRDKNGFVKDSIKPTEREFCFLMKCAVRVGDVGVMDRVVSEIAEDVLVPSADTKDTIISWFKSDHAITKQEQKASAVNSVADLPSTVAPSMGPFEYVVGDDNKVALTWEISTYDTIDSQNGQLLSGCMKDEALKPVQVDTESWSKMIEMNEEIVVNGEIAEHVKILYAGGGKGKKRPLVKDSIDKRVQEWTHFKNFLLEQVGPPCTEEPSMTESKRRFDVVIDGANVGYFKRNFAHAPKHVDYKQIDWMIDHFRSKGKRVLLIMHTRHFGQKMMPSWAEEIVRKWDDESILFRTPFGSNDDWYWMHAALYCGRGTMVISNDLMRDHHFQMLAYRSFLRWKERHQVLFDFGSWSGKKREVLLEYPDVYSRRIQRIGGGLVIPLPKRGDENRFLDGSHEAGDNAPNTETYVCISLKKVT